MEAVMIPREPSHEPFSAADLSGDPVAALRASVERLLIPLEEHLDEWDIELPQALSGPRVTPVLRQQLDELRATVRRCRELGDAMTAAAAVAAASQVDIDAPLDGDGDV
jgi:hypothetical protein